MTEIEYNITIHSDEDKPVYVTVDGDDYIIMTNESHWLPESVAKKVQALWNVTIHEIQED